MKQKKEKKNKILESNNRKSFCSKWKCHALDNIYAFIGISIEFFSCSFSGVYNFAK